MITNLKIRVSCFTTTRVLLGMVFVLSGFLKAIDPVGFGYKVDEYFRFLHLIFPSWLKVSLLIGLFLIALEFVIGVYLVLGIRRKFTAIVSLALMVVFTMVSVVILIYKPVGNCGCFGEFIVLTDMQTFIKNVILLALSIAFFFKYKTTITFAPVSWHWLLSLYSSVFILIFALRSVYYLPVIDYGPYSIGTNVRENVFPIEPENNAEPADFYVTDVNNRDYTSDILFDERPMFLVISPLLEEANTGVTEELNSIYDWCLERGYRMFCLTSSTKEVIHQWSYYNDIQFPILIADNSLLRSIIHSNPGLVLMRDGIVRNKWSCNNLPDITDSVVSEKQFERTPAYGVGVLLRLVLWYLMPMLVFSLLSHYVGMVRKLHSIRKIFNV